MENLTVNIDKVKVAEESTIQVVAFQLGEEEYAVDILHVQEINRLLNITRVPRAGLNIEGVVNLRGHIIPVINLHKKFGLESKGDKNDKRIIVFQLEDGKASIIVDRVSEVLHLETSNIEEADKIYTTIEGEYIKGVGKVGDRLLILLDLQKLLSAQAN